jgi:hypothetical protein
MSVNRAEDTKALIECHKTIVEALEKERSILRGYPDKFFFMSDEEMRKYVSTLRSEQGFIESLRDAVLETHQADTILKMTDVQYEVIDRQYDRRIDDIISWYGAKYHIDGSGIFLDKQDHQVPFRKDVIRKCIKMCECATGSYPTRKFFAKKRYSSSSYSLKHRLENWFQAIDGHNEPHYGYVSNGEACVVILYFHSHDPSIMDVSKHWLECPNINITITENLHAFFEGLPCRLG